MSLLVLSGTGDDPPGRYGIASLTSAMLTEGAGPRSSPELADAIDSRSEPRSVERRRLVFSSDARAGRAARGGTAVDGRRGAASDVSGKELERLRAAAPCSRCCKRATLPARSPRWLSPHHLRIVAPLRDGADRHRRHRYGLYAGRSQRLPHAGVPTWATRTLIIVGDVVPDELLPLLETHFGKWQPLDLNCRFRKAPGCASCHFERLILMDKARAHRSRSILIGGIGVPRSTAGLLPDSGHEHGVSGTGSLRAWAIALLVARSGFDMRKSPGPVRCGRRRTDRRDEPSRSRKSSTMLAGMLKPCQQTSSRERKTDIALRFPTTFEVDGRLHPRRLQSLESLLVYGLSDDGTDSGTICRPFKRSAPSRSSARRRKYLQPDRLAFVIVGDLQGDRVAHPYRSV